MKTQLMYCGACDCEVRVVATDAPSHEGQATLLDAELVCLEIGEKCTGTMCPVCAQPVTGIARDLVRNGLQSEVTHTVQRACTICDHVTDHITVGGGYLVCGECGTTSHVRAPEGSATSEGM